MDHASGGDVPYVRTAASGGARLSPFNCSTLLLWMELLVFWGVKTRPPGFRFGSLTCPFAKCPILQVVAQQVGQVTVPLPSFRRLRTVFLSFPGSGLVASVCDLRLSRGISPRLGKRNATMRSMHRSCCALMDLFSWVVWTGLMAPHGACAQQLQRGWPGHPDRQKHPRDAASACFQCASPGASCTCAVTHVGPGQT